MRPTPILFILLVPMAITGCGLSESDNKPNSGSNVNVTTYQTIDVAHVSSQPMYFKSANGIQLWDGGNILAPLDKMEGFTVSVRDKDGGQNILDGNHFPMAEMIVSGYVNGEMRGQWRSTRVQDMTFPGTPNNHVRVYFFRDTFLRLNPNEQIQNVSVSLKLTRFIPKIAVCMYSVYDSSIVPPSVPYPVSPNSAVEAPFVDKPVYKPALDM